MMESSTKLELLAKESTITHRLYNRQIQKINEYLDQKPGAWADKVPSHVKSLAHLNSRQLIILLDEWIFPLSQRSEYLLNQEKAQTELNRLNANQEKLVLIKQHIHDGLLHRCQISEQFNLPRQVDDLRVHDEEKVKIQKNLAATLDDDNRLIIYDTLIAAGFAKDVLFQHVIKPIPKRSYQPFRGAKALEQAVKHAYEFSDKVCAALQIKRKAPGRLTMFAQKWQQQVTTLFSYLGGRKWPFLWRFRYILYFIFSFAAYYMFTHVLTLMGIMLLSETLFTFLTSCAFYTIALFPLWWIMGDKISQCIDFVQQKWCMPKQSQVVESLLSLEQNEQFINFRLNQVIVDVVHYDFDELKERLNSIQTNTRELIEKLTTFAWTEKIACSKQIKQQIEVLITKLQEQEVALKLSIQHVIQHLMSRTEEELSLLEKEQMHSVLMPTFPKHQYQKIRTFIKEFGTSKELAVFEQKINLAQNWVKKLDQLVLPSSNRMSMIQPWGGQVIRKDLLKGWHILLTQWGDDSESCKSALAINALIRGRKHLTMSDLSKAVSHLAKPQDAQGLLSTIQSVLFSTLSERNLKQARLLSKEQKDLIATWYEMNKDHIAKAKEVMKKVFTKNMPTILDKLKDAELVSMYQILDGADIYHYAHEQKCSRQNQVKRFFEHYQGESSRAFTLCRFIPAKQETQLLTTIATKRLNWIVSHLEQEVDPAKPFDNFDLEFFLQHQLSKQYTAFNVTDAIRKAPEYTQPWSLKMEKFLESCRRYGLDSGKLLTQYQARNVQIKAFLLQQFNQSKCKVASGKENSTRTKRGVVCGKEHHARTKPSISYKSIMC